MEIVLSEVAVGPPGKYPPFPAGLGHVDEFFSNGGVFSPGKFHGLEKRIGGQLSDHLDNRSFPLLHVWIKSGDDHSEMKEIGPGV
jgi:hypothetical protein